VRHDQPLVLIFRLLMLPLFLFSGTFFPVSQLPQALRYLAYALPLWHGVELSRGLYLGTLGTGAAALHLGYLVGLSGLGVLAARATYTRKLAR
jgi:lipooligosaccharide transport system permease protein